ncbi:hypothetical protein MLPF_3269 [Mycobacterium lepromatosis]|nr:hypothetical protein MLPF_1406 [Mycobacterium lepromatosis]UKN42665.1 hypothetical protein MLPF_2305 [Mycobacterium lepromatosis]UKN43040.1 hypothetical protein MLPF_3130 [Mycobacterium lepromatosis]UKN43101.1 hypothetical protein MLPF_3269 [Mycobacterium lepromatosis]
MGKDACTRVGKQSGKRIESIRGTTPRLTQPAAVVVLNVNNEAPDPSSWIAPKPDWATTFKLATKTHPHIQLRVICDNYATHKPPAAGPGQTITSKPDCTLHRQAAHG